MSEESDHTSFAAFAEHHAARLTPCGAFGRGETARVLYAMAHDVCSNRASADAAALRNILLFAIEHQGNLLEATGHHLADPMSRLQVWRIGQGSDQERWMHALNLRQLKNWRAKGVGDYRKAIRKSEQQVRARFSKREITKLNLLQREHGWPEFGRRAKIAVIGAAMGLGAVAQAAAFWG